MSLSTLDSLPALGEVKGRCGYDRKIVFGGLDWDSSRFHVAVARYILEHGFGCRTDVIPGSSLPLITALSTGDIDILMEIWPDNIREAWDRYLAKGSVVELGINFPDAVQGFFVPTYVVKGDPERGIEPVAPELTHVSELAKYKLLFEDPEQPGMGRFHNCILGWTCEEINTKKLHVYGLTEHFINFRPGAAAAVDAAIASHYERGLPLVAYYWGPTWILGKYDLTMLEEPPYDAQVWEAFNESPNPTETTAYPAIKVLIGANADFAAEAKTVVEFLKRYRTTGLLVSQALVYIEDNPSADIEEAAREFLLSNDSVWRHWVDEATAARVANALQDESKSTGTTHWLTIEQSINRFVNHIVSEYADGFDAIARPLRVMIVWVEHVLTVIPWAVLVLIFATMAFIITGRFVLPIVVSVCLMLIVGLGLWDLACQTLALMLIATSVATVIGVPVGILLSKSNSLRSVVVPLLDAMQTMPSFVYLVPALMLFGLGKVPALFATVIYAIPPLIKLTDHGIRMVDQATLEAARSFGANARQLLIGVQLPLALPTIMTGINQTTMLALSMVVIASMIGARGLGEQVLLGIQRLDVGQGFTAGLAIVALAIVLDRITQAVGRTFDNSR